MTEHSDAPHPSIDVRDPKALRALAHPLRLALLGALRRDGAHSVGELSELVDAAPGSVSYHLGTLERFGFVVEAPELARDGRERWWRAAHLETHFDPGSLGEDPDTAVAARAMRATIYQSYLGEQLAYLDAEATLERAWVDAATSGDTIAYLTADETRELSDEVEALARRWGARRDAGRPGVAPVRLIYSTFRQP